jgi:phosphohistidine phosphatase
MALYLVQHGKSLPKEIDRRKGLSEEGIADVKRIAGVAGGYGIRVSTIAHSGKRRAQQTAELFAEVLLPEQGLVRRNDINPLDNVVSFAGTIDSRDNFMYVGHLPFMERLTSYLLTGSIDKPIFKFQNGGIVCLDIDSQSQSWVIKWTLMPDIQ